MTAYILSATLLMVFTLAVLMGSFNTILIAGAWLFFTTVWGAKITK